MWAGGFACSAYYAVADSDRDGFAVFHLVNTDWANVYASFASIALFTNFNFDHGSNLYGLSCEICKIKAFSNSLVRFHSGA